MPTIWTRERHDKNGRVIAVTADERETLAREALAEITPPSTFGDLIGESPEGEGVYTLLFAATMGGYPGWHWTVSVAELPGAAPTVLEAELLPGDGSLLAPEWVPWSDRLDAEDLETLEDLDDDDVAADDDSDDDSDDFADDNGDDPDDGIDFESSDLLAVSEDQQNQPEPEPDDDGPEPPSVAPVKNRRQKKQKPREGE